MKIIIDRIENGIAVVELPDGRIVDAPTKLFSDAVEGDIYIIKKDVTETNKRRKKTTELENKLFQD